MTLTVYQIKSMMKLNLFKMIMKNAKKKRSTLKFKNE